MEYIFLKDHLEFKAGDDATQHPRLQYLIRVKAVGEKPTVKPEGKPAIEPPKKPVTGPATKPATELPPKPGKQAEGSQLPPEAKPINDVAIFPGGRTVDINNVEL